VLIGAFWLLVITVVLQVRLLVSGALSIYLLPSGILFVLVVFAGLVGVYYSINGEQDGW